MAISIQLISSLVILGLVASNPINLDTGFDCANPVYKVFKTCFAQLVDCHNKNNTGCATSMKYCAVAPTDCTMCYVEGYLQTKQDYGTSLENAGLDDIWAKMQEFGSQCRKGKAGMDITCVRNLIGEMKTLLDGYPQDKAGHSLFKKFKSLFDPLVQCEADNQDKDDLVKMCAMKMIDDALQPTLLMKILPRVNSYPAAVKKGVMSYLACKQSADQKTCTDQQLGNIQKEIEKIGCDQPAASKQTN